MDEKKYRVSIYDMSDEKTLSYDELLEFWKKHSREYNMYVFPNHRVIFIPSEVPMSDMQTTLTALAEIFAELGKLVNELIKHIREAQRICEIIMDKLSELGE